MNANNFSHTAVRLFSRLLIIFTFILAGCGGGGSNSVTSTATLTSITVSPLSASISVGGTLGLKAKGLYSDNTTVDLTTKVVWATSASSVASVGSVTGVVTGISAGTATIVAKYNGNNIDTVAIAVTSGGGGAVSVGHLNVARYEQTANLITNGAGKELVLVAGGFGASGNLNSAELYDPLNDTWTTTASLVTERTDHTATTLASGQVLVIGGANSLNSNITSTELYDPLLAKWNTADDLITGRSYHTSTLLMDGNVLVVGGTGAVKANLISAERYDPNLSHGTKIGTWAATDPLKVGRAAHTATLFSDPTQPLYKKVLVVGGTGGNVLASEGVSADPQSVLASAELYDPNTGLWTTSAPLNIPRFSHTATLLQNGKILVTGGFDLNDQPIAQSELYDPVTNKWTLIGNLTTPRALQMAILLTTGPNAGKVLMMGGEVSRGVETKSVEIFDPTSGNWTATDDLKFARDWFTATLLSNGKVLVTGGTDESSMAVALDSSELYWW
jgi:N-acetylneuraminic acid mutarotase